MPETFSSEIGDVHARRGDQPSFTNEFRGASESLIERERPPGLIDVGRRGRRVALVLVLLVLVLGGGGWALWYWSEPIGEWILSWGADEPAEPAVAVEPEPADVAPDEGAASDQPERVFGVQGAGDGGPAAPPSDAPPSDAAPSDAAVEPPPPEPAPVVPPAPAVTPATIEITATTVQGRVASSTVSARLAPVETALEGCWEQAAAKPGAKRPVDLRLRFSIKWNGRAFGIAVTGGAPEAVRTCVRRAVPTSGWPHPSDGGDAVVTRTWTLE